MKDNIQPCEVIESNLLDPTKETDYFLDLAAEGTTDFTAITEYRNNKPFNTYIIPPTIIIGS